MMMQLFSSTTMMEVVIIEQLSFIEFILIRFAGVYHQVFYRQVLLTYHNILFSIFVKNYSEFFNLLAGLMYW